MSQRPFMRKFSNPITPAGMVARLRCRAWLSRVITAALLSERDAFEDAMDRLSGFSVEGRALVHEEFKLVSQFLKGRKAAFTMDERQNQADGKASGDSVTAVRFGRDHVGTSHEDFVNVVGYMHRYLCKVADSVEALS